MTTPPDDDLGCIAGLIAGLPISLALWAILYLAWRAIS